ncbi:ATP-binding SpoIIE family protein phosphatase [Streptomyces arenae]|uniref:ATP-binding SpoIIE family protein phosphatase n=1 Tax=Streptomyces arenae TaxID=29301 RepID=UPI002658FF3C|nr:SpoIIE family protein phosphatase [Streptomyces arenae]MCG7205743.1 SpoIIE family protein phosphatase [Streptomyces arenae]
MDGTADGFLSRVARELVPRADELIADVTRCLRAEIPELWQDAELTRMTSENITEHVVGVLTGLGRGADPGALEPPPSDVDRARRLARRGTPVTAMLRAHRLGEGVILDGFLAELPRLTDDPELIDAVSRRLLAMATGYVDRASEQGVLAFQEERDRRLQWRLSLVNDAGLRIGTTLDITRTTQELADLAAEHFADLVTVDLLDAMLRGHDTPTAEPFLLRRLARGARADGAPEAAAAAARPVPAEARARVHSCPDGSPEARALATGQSSRHTRGTRSWLVVPLSARGTTLGVTRFSRYRDPDPYDDEDLLLAQEIAAKAAVAVDNACRYTHARATALTLQRSLLPHRTAEQSAVEVACRYLPAGARAGVGGDWYDVIPLSGARVALVVGDVVGHGIHAAATMGRLRTAVRTLADLDLPPDELLTHLDDVVIRLASEGSADPDRVACGDIVASCLYAVYDPVAGRCCLARAGHVLPTVLDRDGIAALLDLPAGPPLGLGGLPFEAVEAELPEGSLLALYTDGLIAAHGHDVDEGLASLRDALARPAGSLEDTCDTVLDALLPTDRPRDDVALLLARTHTLGDGQVAVWDLDPDPAAVGPARADVARQLTAWGLEELGFAAGLVVSELVTNAVRYGRPPIRLRLIRTGPRAGPRRPDARGHADARGLLCEVSDAGGATPHLRRARTYDEGGRGLLLVARLAARWGTRHARQGKTVWAELDESEPAAPLPDLAAAL